MIQQTPLPSTSYDNVKAVILVGGPSRGTRFRPLSLTCPKPLFPIAGKPLIYHHILALSLIRGLKEIYLIGFFEDQVFAPFLTQVNTELTGQNVRVKYLREYQALGTAGGIYHFRDVLLANNTKYLFVLHSDICSGCPLESMLQFHVSNHAHALCTLLTFRAPPETTHRYGCVVTDTKTNEIVHYVEKPEFFISDAINGGIYLLNTAVFDLLGKTLKTRSEVNLNTSPVRNTADNVAASSFSGSSNESSSYANFTLASSIDSHTNSTKLRLEVDVLQALAGTNQLFAFESTEFWTQMKTATSAVIVNSHVLQHNKRNRSGSIHSETIQGPHIIGAVSIDSSSHIHPTAKIGPNVSIGPNAIIGPGVRVKESIILDSVEVKANACILYSVIGWNTVVGKWTRVEGQPADGVMQRLMVNGHKTQSATVIGHEVKLADEIIIRNCLVLPHKELKSSYRDDILM